MIELVKNMAAKSGSKNIQPTIFNYA